MSRQLDVPFTESYQKAKEMQNKTGLSKTFHEPNRGFLSRFTHCDTPRRAMHVEVRLVGDRFCAGDRRPRLPVLQTQERSVGFQLAGLGFGV